MKNLRLYRDLWQISEEKWISLMTCHRHIANWKIQKFEFVWKDESIKKVGYIYWQDWFKEFLSLFLKWKNNE